VINVQKIVETHNMLYRLEHWEELDDEEKEAMETLKFIEKAHELLHEHDHLGLGKGFLGFGPVKFQSIKYFQS
jgi:hypothetical protein